MKANRNVESNVKALWIFGRFIRYILESLDEACCTLLAEMDGSSLGTVKVKDFGFFSVGAVSIYLLDWVRIQ